MNSRKRLLILSSLLFCFSIIGKTQIAPGFQLGLNLAKLNGDTDYDENNIRPGVNAYLFADIPLGKFTSMSVETGIGISQQGMNTVHTIDSIALKTIYKTKNKLDYVYVPVYLKENFQNVYVKVGGYGGYLLNAQSDWTRVRKQGFTQIEDETPEGINEEFANNANPYDFGLTFGVGYINYFNNPRRRGRRRRGKRMLPVVQIDFKYNIGLTSIDKSGKVDNMNLRNQVFMIGVSVSSVANK